MHVIRAASRLDELPSAPVADFFDSLLRKYALIRGKENRLVFHLPIRHPLPGLVLSENRLTVGIPVPVHRISRTAVESRTVCSERDVICDRRITHCGNEDSEERMRSRAKKMHERNGTAAARRGSALSADGV